MRSLMLAMILIGLAAPAAAQDRTIARLDLPREARLQLERILADSATTRVDGPYALDPGATVGGNLVVFGGPVIIDGHVSGALVVIGSNVELGQGAMISGDLTVAGGEAYGIEQARVLGTVTMYGEGFRFFGEDDEIVAFGGRRRSYDRDLDRYWGRSSLSLRTGINYNRVEGLPIHIGPVLETGGRYRTRLQAMAILRTGGGGVFDSDHMGFDARLEQFLGRAFRLGVGVHSVIQPIEPAGLTNIEASLSTFLFHEDLRDYYEREGFSVYARYAPRRSNLDASVTFDSDRHRSVMARDPLTIFGSGWRLQPAVGEGTLRTLTARVEYDHRDDEDFPIDGWLLRAEVGRGLGGSLQLPASRLNDSTLIVPAVPLNTEFNRADLDVRVYRPFGPRGTLNFRAAAGGSLDGHSLPPQFQHALGGAGSLPGFDVFALDCGARSSIIRRDRDDFFGGYGCDRYVLGSIEYRGWFDLRFGGSDDDDDWDAWHFDATPSWMFFFDAARGWSIDDATRSSVDSGVFYDAGAGILLGDVGLYAAVPLNGSDRGVNFFVRLGPRF